MADRLAPQLPAQAADVVARAVGAVALATLAMIHVVDLPGTLGPLPLVGAGYIGIIAAAALVGLGGRRRARRRCHGRLRADPHRRRLPRRPQRRRQLAVPARAGRAQRRDSAHPARRLAGTAPQHHPRLAGAARYASHPRVQPARLTGVARDGRPDPEGAQLCAHPSLAREARHPRPRGGGGWCR